MDFGNADNWGDAIYFWIIPLVMGDAIFPPVPSEMLLITGGALSAVGRPNAVLLILLAAAASWLGDILVFQLFKRRLSHVLDRWQWGRSFHRAVHRATGKAGRSTTYGAIIGIRFIPGGRLATTAAAGIANVSTRGFSLCAALGGILSAVWSVGLGYATGAATGLPFWASSLIGVALGILIGAVVGVIVTLRRGNNSPVVDSPGEELDF
ncbi:MAG: VTT domain-containing protein [Arthrobacter sp.]